MSYTAEYTRLSLRKGAVTLYNFGFKNDKDPKQDLVLAFQLERIPKGENKGDKLSSDVFDLTVFKDRDSNYTTTKNFRLGNLREHLQLLYDKGALNDLLLEGVTDKGVLCLLEIEFDGCERATWQIPFDEWNGMLLVYNYKDGYGSNYQELFVGKKTDEDFTYYRDELREERGKSLSNRNSRRIDSLKKSLEKKSIFSVTRGNEAYANVLDAKKTFHKQEVQKALAEGEAVPSEVLADYPELQGVKSKSTNQPEMAWKMTLIEYVEQPDLQPINLIASSSNREEIEGKVKKHFSDEAFILGINGYFRIQEKGKQYPDVRVIKNKGKFLFQQIPDHKEIVKQAILDGKKVPERVLLDYLDLYEFIDLQPDTIIDISDQIEERTKQGVKFAIDLFKKEERLFFVTEKNAASSIKKHNEEIERFKGFNRDLNRQGFIHPHALKLNDETLYFRDPAIRTETTKLLLDSIEKLAQYKELLRLFQEGKESSEKDADYPELQEKEGNESTKEDKKPDEQLIAEIAKQAVVDFVNEKGVDYITANLKERIIVIRKIKSVEGFIRKKLLELNRIDILEKSRTGLDIRFQTHLNTPLNKVAAKALFDFLESVGFLKLDLSKINWTTKDLITTFKVKDQNGTVYTWSFKGLGQSQRIIKAPSFAHVYKENKEFWTGDLAWQSNFIERINDNFFFKKLEDSDLNLQEKEESKPAKEDIPKELQSIYQESLAKQNAIEAARATAFALHKSEKVSAEVLTNENLKALAKAWKDGRPTEWDVPARFDMDFIFEPKRGGKYDKGEWQELKRKLSYLTSRLDEIRQFQNNPSETLKEVFELLQPYDYFFYETNGKYWTHRGYHTKTKSRTFFTSLVFSSSSKFAYAIGERKLEQLLPTKKDRTSDAIKGILRNAYDQLVEEVNMILTLADNILFWETDQLRVFVTEYCKAEINKSYLHGKDAWSAFLNKKFIKDTHRAGYYLHKEAIDTELWRKVAENQSYRKDIEFKSAINNLLECGKVSVDDFLMVIEQQEQANLNYLIRIFKNDLPIFERLMQSSITHFIDKGWKRTISNLKRAFQNSKIVYNDTRGNDLLFFEGMPRAIRFESGNVDSFLSALASWYDGVKEYSVAKLKEGFKAEKDSSTHYHFLKNFKMGSNDFEKVVAKYFSSKEDYPELQVDSNTPAPKTNVKKAWQMTKTEYAIKSTEQLPSIAYLKERILSIENTDYAYSFKAPHFVLGKALQSYRDDFELDLLKFLNNEDDYVVNKGLNKLNQRVGIYIGFHMLSDWRKKRYKDVLNSEEHKTIVQKALADGKAVPSAVLEDYPELQENEKSKPAKEAISKELSLSDKRARIIKSITEDYFEKGIRMTPKKAQNMAIYLGITDQSFFWESAELAWTLYYRKILAQAKAQNKSFKEALDQVWEWYSKIQPSFNQSSSIKRQMQQYSTPAPISLGLAIWLGEGMNSTRRKNAQYFEPSGGNGLLAFVLPIDAVTINELDVTRYENLKSTKLANGKTYKSVLNQDATLPFPQFDRKFDGVLSNPPFGGQVPIPTELPFSGMKTAKLENLMSGIALESMKDDGRAAFIVHSSHGTFDRKGKIRKDPKFWEWVNWNYYIIDIITLEGQKLYNRQGTASDTAVILIDGRRPTPNQKELNAKENPIWHQRVSTIEDYYQRIQNALRLSKLPKERGDEDIKVLIDIMKMELQAIDND